MTKICLHCKQELPINLFKVVTVKGVQKHQQATCTPCMQAYRKAYYEANKERCKKQVREWNKRNPDYHTNWQKANPDKLKRHREAARPRAQEYMREQYWKDPEAARLRVRQYKKAHPEQTRERKRNWTNSNREHLRAYYNGKSAQLSDSYVRNKLSKNSKQKEILASGDIPQALVELKRIQILIQRELKNEKRRSTT